MNEEYTKWKIDTDLRYKWFDRGDHISRLILQSRFWYDGDIYILFDGNRFESEFSFLQALYLDSSPLYALFISFVVEFRKDSWLLWLADR